MLPAFMCDARIFLHQIAGLSAQASIIVPSLTQGDTIADMAQSVLELAPERFSLCGLSLGGVVAMEILRRAPERVSRLAILSASAQSETPTTAADREPLIVMAKSGRLEEAMAATMVSSAEVQHSRDDSFDDIMNMANELGPDVFVNQSRALQKRPDQQKTMRLAKLPAYIIAGEQDTLTPVRRQEFMAELLSS